MYQIAAKNTNNIYIHDSRFTITRTRTARTRTRSPNTEHRRPKAYDGHRRLSQSHFSYSFHREIVLRTPSRLFQNLLLETLSRLEYEVVDVAPPLLDDLISLFRRVLFLVRTSNTNEVRNNNTLFQILPVVQ